MMKGTQHKPRQCRLQWSLAVGCNIHTSFSLYLISASTRRMLEGVEDGAAKRKKKEKRSKDRNRQKMVSCMPSRQKSNSYMRKDWRASASRAELFLSFLSVYEITLSERNCSFMLLQSQRCVHPRKPPHECIISDHCAGVMYIWRKKTKPDRQIPRVLPHQTISLSSFHIWSSSSSCLQRTGASESFEACGKQVLICYLCEKLRLNEGFTSYNQSWRGTWWLRVLVALRLSLCYGWTFFPSSKCFLNSALINVLQAAVILWRHHGGKVI